MPKTHTAFTSMCLGHWKFMKSLMNVSARTACFVRFASIAGVVVGAAVVLTGCYVVPVQPDHHPAPVVYAPAPQLPPASVTFAARLYPANELAAAYGMVNAVVTNDLNGRGTFSTAINGEGFTGEATRMVGASREGVANGTGNRGSYINCRYQMNSTTLGSGQCKLSNGAQFTMHVGG
jgi:hypothetical protein